MTLVYACIAPHGGEIIPELASKAMLPKFEETRAAMRVLAKRISETLPQTVVIASPHNLRLDRKSTRLNSSHRCISYAVFCLKKKKTIKTRPVRTTAFSILIFVSNRLPNHCHSSRVG